MPRTKDEIMTEYEKTTTKISKIYEVIHKLEQKLYSLAMEYRHIVIDEKKAESEGQADRLKKMYMHD